MRQPHDGPKRRLQLPFGHQPAPHASAACKKRGLPHRTGPLRGIVRCCLLSLLQTLSRQCCSQHLSLAPLFIVSHTALSTFAVARLNKARCWSERGLYWFCCCMFDRFYASAAKTSLSPASPRNIVTRRANSVRLLAVARRTLLHLLLVVVIRSKIRIWSQTFPCWSSGLQTKLTIYEGAEFAK